MYLGGHVLTNYNITIQINKYLETMLLESYGMKVPESSGISSVWSSYCWSQNDHSGGSRYDLPNSFLKSIRLSMGIKIITPNYEGILVDLASFEPAAS